MASGKAMGKLTVSLYCVRPIDIRNFAELRRADDINPAVTYRLFIANHARSN
jgi:hypothetical protein